MAASDSDRVWFFNVTDPTTHSEGYTIYKVIAQGYPASGWGPSTEAVNAGSSSVNTPNSETRFLQPVIDESDAFIQNQSRRASSQVAIWKRYNEFRDLHRAMLDLHKQNGNQTIFPSIPKSVLFGRFDDKVVEERRKSFQTLLTFIANHRYLSHSDAFKAFWEGGRIKQGNSESLYKSTTNTTTDRRQEAELEALRRELSGIEAQKRQKEKEEEKIRLQAEISSAREELKSDASHSMGAGVVKPQPGGGFEIHINPGRRPASRTAQTQPQQQRQSDTAGVRTSNNPASMNCEECTVQFSVFKKKKTCKDCNRIFCSSCTVQLSGESVRQCKRCQILLAGNFTRSQLTDWKIKDLRALLHKNNVNTTKCKEKDDLIDLNFRHFGNMTHDSSRRGTEHERLVEQLAERMRQEELASNPQPPSAPPTEPQAPPQQQTQPTARPTVLPQGVPESEQLRQRQQQEMRETEERIRRQLEEENSEPQPANPHVKIDDIKSESEIEKLTIKELKRLLLNNFVDYKGCVERWELQERVRRLWRDNEANKKRAEEQRILSENPSSDSTGAPAGEDDICKICMDATIDCVLLECGHMVTCTNCGKRLSECPMCRQYVVRAVHTFRA